MHVFAWRRERCTRWSAMQGQPGCSGDAAGSESRHTRSGIRVLGSSRTSPHFRSVGDSRDFVIELWPSSRCERRASRVLHPEFRPLAPAFLEMLLLVPMPDHERHSPRSGDSDALSLPLMYSFMPGSSYTTMKCNHSFVTSACPAKLYAHR